MIAIRRGAATFAGCFLTTFVHIWQLLVGGAFQKAPPAAAANGE
jgi:hypothetical protein